MKNCKLDSLRGYSYKVKDSIVNCPHYLNGGFLMLLANSIQFFNGQKTIVIFESKRQISAICMRGNYICIGQKASPGQLISAVLLDINNLQKPKIFNYQKTQIQFITVSQNGQFICSIGSSSEGNQQLKIIQVNNQSEVGTRVLYTRVLNKKDGKAKAVKFSTRDPTVFVLLCSTKVILMRIDAQSESVQEVEVKTSKVRQYNNIIFSPDDTFLYGCSKNGDLTEISVDQNKEVRVGPRKRVITKGITNIKYVHPNHLIICGNQGLIALISIQTMAIIKQIRIQNQQITSFSEVSNNNCFFATNKAAIYKLNTKTFDTQLLYNCHTTKITNLTFIKDFQTIFGTCSGEDIIIWNTRTLTPILKISIPKFTCVSLCFPKNGKHILSGWSDDCIRIFSPKNGKLVHKIANVNLQQVTTLTSDQDSTMMIGGGENGVIRLWNILQNKMFGLILGSLAFHMKPVYCLQISPFNSDQMISCCDDGKFAIWSLSKFELRSSFYITSFLNDAYFISETVIRTFGAGNIIYDVLISNGHILGKRLVDGTMVNAVAECYFDITNEKIIYFGVDEPYLYYVDLTYQSQKIQKLPSYGSINKLAFTPDQSTLIAVTDSGVILNYSIFAIKTTKSEDEW